MNETKRSLHLLLGSLLDAHILYEPYKDPFQ